MNEIPSMAGVYVHIPFCRRKCVYCDFYSVGERRVVWSDFVGALLREAYARISELRGEPVCTIYIGGGTPSLLPCDEFGRLVDGLLSLTGSVDEFTIEVNPDDVTDEKVDFWRDKGVNRVSMGVQSMVDSELKAIGRRHDAAAAMHAFDILRGRFDNVSIDLMFGLPWQTVDSFQYSVNKVIALGPEHISAYSLMYEERTAITRMRDAGQLREVPEEISGEMFRQLSETLAGAGYEQYEISNYSRPGFRSRHNSAYWRGEPYLGLGPAAHSYDGERQRRANVPDVKAYVDYWMRGGQKEPAEFETLTDLELREEMIMTRLRTREGIDLAEFRRRFGDEESAWLQRRAAKWIDAGNLTVNDGCVALTKSGVMISDEIMADLF